MRSLSFAFVVIAVFSPTLHSQELTKEQLEPWKALEMQVGHFMADEWDQEDKYLHPQLHVWGDELPTPMFATEKAKSYVRARFGLGHEPMKHHLVPVSVVVVDDVAIINAYVHAIFEGEHAPRESIYRLHNTWKKDAGQWKLLATYNTTVVNHDADDDD